MKKVSSYRYELMASASLIAISALLYLITYIFERDAHHLFNAFLEDVAFLPMYVLIVSLIIDRLLSRREKLNKMQKLNMVIGVFFSETGTDLLRMAALYDKNADFITQNLIVRQDWREKEFADVVRRLNSYEPQLEIPESSFTDFKIFLSEKRDFLLRLLENPNLLEHQSFTELLWAVFHLAEELVNRKNIEKLSATDHRHITTDTARAYKLLIKEWLMYMRHLKKQYPYLFSFALRMQPFDKNAAPEIKE